MPTRANIDIGAALAEAEGLYRERNPKSLAQHREACAAMPGGNTRSAIHVDPFPLTMAHGEGARLWDIDGHEYIDFLSEFTAGIFGHSHPAIRQAIEAALDQGLNFGAHNATEARFADKTMLGRNGEPEDIANAIAFLAAPDYLINHQEFTRS